MERHPHRRPDRECGRLLRVPRREDHQRHQSGHHHVSQAHHRPDPPRHQRLGHLSPRQRLHLHLRREHQRDHLRHHDHDHGNLHGCHQGHRLPGQGGRRGKQDRLHPPDEDSGRLRQRRGPAHRDEGRATRHRLCRHAAHPRRGL